MKIINIDSLVQYSYTVDSVDVTVDSIIVTADSTFTTNGSLYLLITPREYADEVKIIFYNEITEEVHEQQNLTEIQGNYLKIYFYNPTFKEGDQFELTVKNLNDKIIYKTKAYVTLQDDLQNFKMILPNNNKKIIF